MDVMTIATGKTCSEELQGRVAGRRWITSQQYSAMVYVNIKCGEDPAMNLRDD